MKTSSILVWLLPVLATAQNDKPPAWQTGVVTEDGTCGAAIGWVCSPTWGACCGKDNTCGRSSKFCGDGCQADFGNCNAKAPVVTLGPGSTSPDGSCGGASQFNCTGSPFGDCCSSSGFCGNTTSHCSAGCQSLFGTCNTGADLISTDGSCGANGKTCKGSAFGDCCSSLGYCGAKPDHCEAGCQSAFGTCTTGSDTISTDGKCGANGKTCKGSSFGDCCSSSGNCGSKSDHCAAGCQVTFGTCSAGSDTISTDGHCGANGKTCEGSTYGDCCSAQGYCGTSEGHCSAGCQSAFGTCSTSSSSKISTDGFCGSNGKICTGSSYGDCCSAQGYCGKTSAHCDAGCQSLFGTCSAGSSQISTDGSCATNGKTCYGSTFGNCCSKAGYCGKTTAFCGSGCQAGFGICEFPTVTSTDGNCGPKNGKICLGSEFGNCCSQYGSCGVTAAHCGTGCQKGYGDCFTPLGN